MAKYFVDCVEEVGGCPSLLRTDCGTENVVIAGVQSFLRAEYDDDLAGEKAHCYGPSTGNQWIEAWWSYYRRSCLTWWITFFKDLMDRGVFLPGNTLHQECLWFCFADSIQQDLDFVKIHRNTHYIGQQGLIQFPENQMNYIFSQKTLVPQISCNQCLLKSLMKPEWNIKQLIQRMTFRSTLIIFLSLCNISKPPTGEKL